MQKKFRLIGQRIKKLRQEKGWTQEYLACLLGLHQVDLAKFETGAMRPSKVTLRALKSVFGVSIMDIVGKQIAFYSSKEREFFKE